MLAEIANALQTYNEEGVAVLKRTEEHDAIELAEYVVMVLDALKCSYSYEYDESTGTAILRDDMHN